MTGATTTSGGSPVDAPVTLGDESTNSATSLRHLRSKIVEGLGAKKSSIAAIPPSSAAGGGEHAVPANVGAAGKVAGGVGFAGSLLGEVLVSYSTSTLPPGKRHSISATSAHFEELAAEAGIDLDADDINIEDLRMYKMEDGDSNFGLDDDSDDNAGYGTTCHGGINENGDTNTANQKLAHKERSIFLMVDVLSDRLTSLNSVVRNRYNGCRCDLDEATEFRSSRTKKMQAVVAEEDWNGTVSTHKGTVDKAKRAGMFTSGQSWVGGDGGDGSHAGEPTRLVFRNAPQTDAGRKLAHQFEQVYGSKQASSTTPKFNKSMTGKLKRVEKYKKTESRRQERLHFERRLQSNLDSYVTRAVTELTYRMPQDLEAAAGPESRQPTPGTGDPVYAAVTSEAMAKERFPIPVESNEMNPKLLLSYACERTVLPGGARMFRHFATSLDSQQLFVYVFWFIHCKFFQEDSQQEQVHLLRCVADRYVGVLGTEGMEDYKDFFFKHYPFVVSNAILWGFHYLCPGSRHLYSNAFKRVLYLQCSRILSGVEVIPSSTIEMRTKLFPDETAEALDELEYHPHHVHASGARGSGGPTPGAPAPAGATGAAGAVPSTASSPTAPGVPANSPQAVFGGGIGAEASPRAVESAQGGGGGAVGAAGDGTEARGACGRGGSRGRKDGGGEGKGASMMQRMSKTFRPDPLAAYAGDRSTLKFKPRRQEGLTTLRPRQQRTVFDAAQISPLLQEFLGQTSSTAGRRSENIVRTVPVPWCHSGGTDTHRRHPSRKELHDAIKLEHAKAKREYIRGKVQAAVHLRRTLRHVDTDRHGIFRKGPRQIGLKSMDIVTELQQRGALKGFRRREHQWN